MVSKSIKIVIIAGIICISIIVANKLSSSTVGKIVGHSSSWDIYVSKDFAYVADANNGLQIIDVSNPIFPRIVGNYPIMNAQKVYVSEKIAYVTGGDCMLHILDITNPSQPIELANIDFIECSFVSENILYAARGCGQEMGLEIYDINDPNSPTILGTFDDDGWIKDVFISENIAYLVGGRELIRLIDVNDPTNLTLLGSFMDDQTPQHIGQNMFISGNIAYIAEAYEGLRAINVSNPSNPIELWHLKEDIAWDVYVYRDIAYIATDWDGLTLINVSDPNNPIKLSQIKDGGFIESVYISGNFAYVTGDDLLQIIDLESPNISFGFIQNKFILEPILLLGIIFIVIGIGKGIKEIFPTKFQIQKHMILIICICGILLILLTGNFDFSIFSSLYLIIAIILMFMEEISVVKIRKIELWILLILIPIEIIITSVSESYLLYVPIFWYFIFPLVNSIICYTVLIIIISTILIYYNKKKIDKKIQKKQLMSEYEGVLRQLDEQAEISHE